MSTPFARVDETAPEAPAKMAAARMATAARHAKRVYRTTAENPTITMTVSHRQPTCRTKVLLFSVESRHGPQSVACRRRAAGTAGTDGRRERRAARRLDRDVGDCPRLAAREGRRDRGCGGDRRGRQPVVHARRGFGPCAASRRAYRLRPQWWLARRLPQR